MVLAAFLLGFTFGYAAPAKPPGVEAPKPAKSAALSIDANPGAFVQTAALLAQINPKDGYPLGFSYGDLGPKLAAAGVIDTEAFVALYEQAGQPLDEAQVDALTLGSDEEVVITAQNSYFLLNFFWAVGLANRNSILTEGPMAAYGDGNIRGICLHRRLEPCHASDIRTVFKPGFDLIDS